MQSTVDWLKGIRIVVTGSYIPAPMAAYLLHCLGAEVIKVEGPGYDLLRNIAPHLNSEGQQMSAFFRAVNGGFKSIGIDIKQEGGQEILSELLLKSDILFDGNRTGMLEKAFGATLNESFPELTHIPITAYGQKGPMRDKAGHDNNALAIAGTLSYASEDSDGKPGVFSAQVADMGASMTAAMLGLASLIGKQNKNSTFKEFKVDASMLHMATFLNQLPFAAMNADNRDMVPKEEWMNGAMPNYRVYMTKDEMPVFFGPIETHLFQNFLVKIDQEALSSLQNKPLLLIEELKVVFRTKTCADWEHFLADVDCCFTPINKLSDAKLHAQIKALNLLEEVDDPTFGKLELGAYPAGIGSDGFPPRIPNTAPSPGQHTDEVLQSLLGHSEEKCQEFRRNGAVF